MTNRILMIDRYILEIVFEHEYASFVDEFDMCEDLVIRSSMENEAEDIYLSRMR